MKEENSFVITLTKKIQTAEYSRPTTSYSFNTLSSDFLSIYTHFSLLSYLTPACKITIIMREPLAEEPSIIVDTFEIEGEDQNYYLFEEKKDPYAQIFEDTSEKKELKIEYSIGTSKEGRSGDNRVTVIFCIEKTEIADYIHIKVNDRDGWITNKFSHVSKMKPLSRMSDMRKTHSRELQYYYQEPKMMRTKKIQGEHLSIALQGGGVKGLAYIGAYNGIKKTGDKKISSIIGSSAGGILGLAICCDIAEEDIRKLIVEDLSAVTEVDQRYPEEDVQFVKEVFSVLKRLVHGYGFLDDYLVGVIQDIINDKRFKSCILELLEKFNPSIKLLFSERDDRDKLSVTGLFKAALMSGNAMGNIGVKCLTFLKQKLNKDKGINETEKEMRDWAEKLNMKELYNITGKQFTCTSVDIDSQILRFFNHKTTPHLPVHKAVQMTGSFPVAFEAQRWQESWGKYYIHYDRLRREVDLRGHQFTDGGMLANFPVKYLDNENMRPMYFSHPKIDEGENKTIMYGFGLNAIKEVVPQDFSPIFTRMKNIAMDHVSYFSAGWRLVTGYFGDTDPVTQNIDEKNNPFALLKEIPLFDFIGRLLNTYISTKDNLTEECFAHDTYETEIDDDLRTLKLKSSYVSDNCKNLKTLLDIFEEDAVKQLKNASDQPQAIFEVLMDNLDILKQELLKRPYTEFSILEIESALNFVMTKYMFVRVVLGQQKGKDEELKKAFEQYFEDLDTMHRFKIFSLCDIKEDFYKIEEIIGKVKQFFHDTMSGQRGDHEATVFKLALVNIRNMEVKKINYFHKILSDYNEILIKGTKEDGYIPMDRDAITDLMKLSKSCLTTKLRSIQKIRQAVKTCKLEQFQIYFESFFNRATIRAYVQRILEEGFKKGTNKIHIVLESVPLSQLYFHEYMTFVNDAIEDFNDQRPEEENMVITSLTASNFHSVVMFLYASDLPPERVHKEVWNIRHLLRLNPALDEQFDSFIWTRNNELLMKDLQEETWKNHTDIYDLMDNYLQENKRNFNINDLDEKILDKRSQSAHSADGVYQAMVTSIDYVVESVYNVDRELSPEDQMKQLSKNLSLNLEKKKDDYENQNRENAKQTKKLVEYLANRFLDFAKYTMYSSPFVHEQIFANLNEEDQRIVWKGLILCEVMNVFKLKSYVCETLIELGLKPQTTLSEFYDLSEKKITLNFTAIEATSDRVAVFNHKTRPYMPLWAAIVTTTSIPEFYKPVSDLREWSYMPGTSFNERSTKQYFKDTKPNDYLRSADILTKLPLDLLSNEKFKKRITDDRDQVFLSFNFGNYRLDSENFVKKITGRPFSVAQLYKKSDQLKYMSCLGTLPTVLERMDRLALYVNSHDNLITSIYKKELAELPIRVQTLDFDLMTSVNAEGHKILSPIAEDAIMQSKYVVAQKIINNDENSRKRFLFFRVENKRENKNQDLVIRFLSMLNPTRSMLERFKIFYTLDYENLHEMKKYKEVTTEYLSLKFPEDSRGNLYLMITYPRYERPGEDDSLSRETMCHKIDLSNVLRVDREKFGHVYKLKFNQFLEQNEQMLPEDEPQVNLPVNYKSYVGPEMHNKYKFFCDKCYGNRSEIIHEEISINEESRDSKQTHCSGLHCESLDKSNIYALVYKCPTCAAHYCASCKFKPTLTATGLKCPDGHQLKKLPTRLSHYEETGKLKFFLCDLCMNVSIAPMLYDEGCNVHVCELCKVKFLSHQ